MVHTPPVPSRTVAVSIAARWTEVAAVAGDPANLPRWAAGLGAGIRATPTGWIAQTPDGTVRLRFAPLASAGILDHVVVLPSGREVAVPMRVVANGDGAEVLLTLFRAPGTSDAQWDEDARLVAADLARLKALLEAR